MTGTATRRRTVAPPGWTRVLAVLAPGWAVVLGAAMAVQWELGAGSFFVGSAPGAGTVGPWMAEHLSLMSGGDPVWWWRGPFFVSLLLVLPLVWHVSAAVPSVVSRVATRGGLVAAAVVIGVEYALPGGHGWIVDLAALLVALAGTVGLAVSGARTSALPRRVVVALASALPLTPLAGFLVFWYLPPGLAVGLLLAWAGVAVVVGPPQRTFST